MTLPEMNSSPLAGRTVLVTGNITGMSRDQAKEAVTTLGGTPVASVTQKTDLVVVGEGAGVSKTGTARARNLLTIDAETFLRLCTEPTLWDGTPVGVPFAEWETINGPSSEPPLVPGHATGHSVGKVVLHAPNDEGDLERQVRFWCECGHRWMRNELNGDDTCPQPEVPNTTVPQGRPAHLRGR